ncbi:deoxyribose-phosphate aldolase [Veillonella tobetsuensis]|uniref:Deoxyribose-phosphate aldolase n=1 Tax=Veillonella tobetsuensis TaxID=1110546 RepID=A0A480B3H8_9FIRM|nr:deoxyribose-phosphate aldolase [Veillonella tobetsuensis]GCL68599.1 deoxyribose-phosphate aldolase [Veillonella tobetsuensis]
MLGKELLTYVDHTLLNPIATWEEIKVVCEDALAYHTASVCIPPDFVASAHNAYPDLTVCTVVGFPLGYQTTEAKVAETKQAIEEGASEIDMVINLGDVKQGDYHAITEEIKALKAICGEKILKVIIEACSLTKDEKVELCRCVTEGGADFIKTSTGFGSGGATLEDVQLIKKHIGPHVQIKAAGGIRSVEAMKAYIEAGCTRIGASAAVGLLQNRLDEQV